MITNSELRPSHAICVRISNHRYADPMQKTCNSRGGRVYYLPLPDVGSGNDVVEPRFTLLLLEIVEAFEDDFEADLLE